MSKLYFKPSDFNISGEPIPEKIADKIQIYHIEPMQVVRCDVGFAIWPSLKSGFRSLVWEIRNRRSGKSQHCFGQLAFGVIEDEKGAVDWTCTDFENNKTKLFLSIVKNTKYTRITIYPTFIHCDYKKTKSGKREVYTSGSDSKWKLKETL